MTGWKLGQFVRVWRGGTLGEHDAGGYEYGHIETIDGIGDGLALFGFIKFINPPPNTPVMLIGDDGVEIFCQVKDLEDG